MSTSPTEELLLAHDLAFVSIRREMYLMIRLRDGRAVGAPLSLFPTLKRATPAQRARWRLIGRGDGFQWPALDLDLSVRGILLGIGEAAGEGSTPRARKRAG